MLCVHYEMKLWWLHEHVDPQHDKKVGCMKKSTLWRTLHVRLLNTALKVKTLNSWQPLTVTLMEKLIFMKLKINNIAYLNASRTLYFLAILSTFYMFKCNICMYCVRKQWVLNSSNIQVATIIAQFNVHMTY